MSSASAACVTLFRRNSASKTVRWRKDSIPAGRTRSGFRSLLGGNILEIGFNRPAQLDGKRVAAPVAHDGITASPAAASAAPGPATAAVITQPAADPVIDSPDPARTVAALDPGAPVSSGAASAARKPDEPASAGIGTADSPADKASPDETKITESKTPPPSVVATVETGSKEGTGKPSGEAASPGLTAPAEAKSVTSGVVPQEVPTDAASMPAPAEATAKIAALGIPMPVERPKTLRKASLAAKPKPVVRKHIVRRAAVRHARTARPAQQEQPANPFAASPFGLN